MIGFSQRSFIVAKFGGNIVINKGVAVVCGNFLDNIIYAGNPARIVKENEE